MHNVSDFVLFVRSYSIPVPQCKVGSDCFYSGSLRRAWFVSFFTLRLGSCSVCPPAQACVTIYVCTSILPSIVSYGVLSILSSTTFLFCFIYRFVYVSLSTVHHFRQFQRFISFSSLLIPFCVVLSTSFRVTTLSSIHFFYYFVDRLHPFTRTFVVSVLLSRHDRADEATADPERLGVVPQTPLQDEKGAGGRTIATASRRGHGR